VQLLFWVLFIFEPLAASAIDDSMTLPPGRRSGSSRGARAFLATAPIVKSMCEFEKTI
jgi:hypothetical protein